MPKKKTRRASKYQAGLCSICGEAYSSGESNREHLNGRGDVGRCFVTNKCGNPYVRRSHFKCNHTRGAANDITLSRIQKWVYFTMHPKVRENYIELVHSAPGINVKKGQGPWQ